MCASTVASNFEIEVSRTILHAVSVSRPPLPLLAIAASTFFAASMYFFPLFFGIELLHHLESHRPRGALDHLHRVLGVERIEVLALHVNDLTNLLAGHTPDLLPAWLARALSATVPGLQQLHPAQLP